MNRSRSVRCITPLILFIVLIVISSGCGPSAADLTATADVLTAVADATQTQITGATATGEAHAYATVRAGSVATQREAGMATRIADVTATAEASLSLSGVPAGYQLRYYEDFETNTTTYIWRVEASGNNDYSRQTKMFEDGAYVWQARAKQGFITWEFPEGVSTNGDFYLAVDAWLADGEPAARYGLVFRLVNANDFYVFYVNSQGFYWVLLHQGEAWWRLDAGNSNAILSGSAMNKLAVSGIGDTLTFLVNDQQVDTLTDTTFSKGNVGLIIELSYGGAEATIGFDNFLLLTP